MKNILFVTFIILISVGCSNKTTRTSETDNIIEENSVGIGYSQNSGKNTPQKIKIKERLTGGNINMAIPNATIFRMSGDYSENVGVTLSSDGNLTYFPAPSDITADSAPIKLQNGWWLNCQGLGPNSVFTKYTFAEYASLPETPSPTQIKREIIPGAKVTEFKELPIKLGEALNNPEAVNEYIKDL